MTKQAGQIKTSRKRYTQEFRGEALALAEKVGVAKAARELGLHDSQLYGWRVKARTQSDCSEINQNQMVEIARLKRKLAEQAEELAIVKKAATYFARNQK